MKNAALNLFFVRRRGGAAPPVYMTCNLDGPSFSEKPQKIEFIGFLVYTVLAGCQWRAGTKEGG